MREESIVKIIQEMREEQYSYPEEQQHLYHKNCGETLIEACIKKYEIDIDERVYKTCAPYGFGCGVGKGCGCFAGTIATIGLLFTLDKPSDNIRMKEITKHWANTFLDHFKSIDCEYIRSHKKGDSCLPVQEEAAKLFEDFMKQYIK